MNLPRDDLAFCNYTVFLIDMFVFNSAFVCFEYLVE